MTAKQRAAAAVNALRVLYPEAICSLEYDGEGWKLLVMGRLSAQCKDERVNIVCKDLFEKYQTAESIAYADVADIMEIKGERYEYETNMLLETKRRSIPIKEVPVRILSA